MNLKNIALAAMLAGSVFTSAHAGTINGENTPDIQLIQNSINPDFWTAGFNNVPVNDSTGTFTDIFTFTPALTGSALGSAAVVNIALTGFGEIAGFSASLNGNFFTSSGNGFYTLDPVLLGPGQLVLTITGEVTGAGGSYGGNLNVLTVPEPETYGMMLGGLGLLGYMARRRKQQG
ncbi:MAG: FxDxF family PEP-CTERM protein [Duganella sp.]